VLPLLWWSPCSASFIHGLPKFSFSPPGKNDRQVTVSSSRSLISHQYLTMSLTTHPPNPRIMYLLLTYPQSNPGFYYDLMQNSTHAASQTNLVQTSTSDYVPTPTYMPTHSPTYYTLELHTFCLTQPSILIICHNQYHLLIMIFTAHLFIMEECHITQRSVKIMDHHRFQTTPMWAYTYTRSTRRASSRKPRGDPTGNPAEHPGGTCRPSGPQGQDIRHRALRSQPCTASANAGGAIRTLFG